MLVVAIAVTTGCSFHAVDLAAMRAGAPAPAIGGSKSMEIAFTAWTGLQLVAHDGRVSPWMTAGTLYLDHHSVCVDAGVSRWPYLVSIAVRAPDARAVASITRPVQGITIGRAGEDWVLRGTPDALRWWLTSHLQALEDLEANEPGVQRGEYFAGMEGAAHWLGPSDPFHLQKELDGTGIRVGWLWDEIATVRAIPGERMMKAQLEAETAQVTAWITTPTTTEQGGEDKWMPVPCPSGDTAPKRYAPPPESMTP